MSKLPHPQKRAPAPRNGQADRNSHEFSAEESVHTAPLEEQKRGGGHRSGSSGSGTLELDAPPSARHEHANGRARP